MSVTGSGPHRKREHSVEKGVEGEAVGRPLPLIPISNPYDPFLHRAPPSPPESNKNLALPLRGLTAGHAGHGMDSPFSVGIQFSFMLLLFLIAFLFLFFHLLLSPFAVKQHSTAAAFNSSSSSRHQQMGWREREKENGEWRERGRIESEKE